MWVMRTNNKLGISYSKTKQSRNLSADWAGRTSPSFSDPGISTLVNLYNFTSRRYSLYET